MIAMGVSILTKHHVSRLNKQGFKDFFLLDIGGVFCLVFASRLGFFCSAARSPAPAAALSLSPCWGFGLPARAWCLGAVGGLRVRARWPGSPPGPRRSAAQVFTSVRNSKSAIIIGRQLLRLSEKKPQKKTKKKCFYLSNVLKKIVYLLLN